MAFVKLTPVGHSRESVVDDLTFKELRAGYAELEAKLTERRREVREGWGAKYAARVHEKHKMTTRERLVALCDEGSELFEVGTFVNYGEQFGKLTSPAAGVITVFGRVHGRLCVIIANDNTVASGAWWPRTPEKIQRAQGIALKLRLPTLYLVDCSGLYLPEQRRSFSGQRGAGHIFKMNSLLSDAGVPQVAGVFGDCIAGGGYMPIISDRVYMTEQAYMVIAGAALIKGAKSQKITSLDIGGPEVHVHESGCADVRVPDDEVALACIRREVEKLPSSGAEFYRHGRGAIEPGFAHRELRGLIPPDHREVYDAKQVLARLAEHPGVRAYDRHSLPDFAGVLDDTAFTVETDGRLPSGATLKDAIAAVDAATGNYPAYFMVNCAHPTHFSQVLDSDWTQRIGGIRANASAKSHAELDAATMLDSGDPQELGKQYRDLRRLLPRANVLGGCCGTDHRHVAAICHACAA